MGWPDAPARQGQNPLQFFLDVVDFARRNPGPMTAIRFDQAYGTMRCGGANQGDDHGIGR